MFIFQQLANVSWSYLVRTGDLLYVRKNIALEHEWRKPCHGMMVLVSQLTIV